MWTKDPSILLISILISTIFINPSTCSASKLDDQILELKIKAITSVELSSMSFNELPSLFFLYENLVNKRFQSVHKKDPKKFEEFRKVHQYHAIRSSFYSLELRDVTVNQEFNLNGLKIFKELINWSDNELSSYGFIGKDKNKKFKFHEKAVADFFIAEYFYDNIVQPKGDVSDDEMELRLRFLLYVIANHNDRKPLMHYFTLDMFEDQNGEMFSDQVRMLMQYKFRYLLDGFLPNELDNVEKISKIFAKDEEILENLWGIDQDQPYYLRFFRFTSSVGLVQNLKDVAKKFFIIGADSQADTNLTSNSTKIQAENIFRGKNQVLNVLYRIYEKNDENFTKDILDVTKYEVSDEILTKLSQEKNFLDFVDQSNFTVIDKRNFYLANNYELISNARTGENLMKIWRRIQKYFSAHELKGIITEKDMSFNTTQLFLLPSHSDQKFVEGFLSLTKRYLTVDEIKDFLDQRTPITRESFIVRYIGLAHDENIVRITWNFAKNYLNAEELRKLIFDHSGSSNPSKFPFLINFN